MTLQEFNFCINSDVPVVAVFHANSWCRQCQRTIPRVEAAAKELAGRLKFIFIDLNDYIKEEEEIRAYYNVYSVPTLLLFKQGELLDRYSGEEISNLFANWLIQVSHEPFSNL